MRDVLQTNHAVRDVLQTNHAVRDVLQTNHAVRDVLQTNHAVRDVLQTIISVHVILERLGMQSLRPHRTFNMVLCHRTHLCDANHLAILYWSRGVPTIRE